MAIEHVDAPDGERHEPKGLAAATTGQIYVARGGDTGEWIFLPAGWGNYSDNATAQTFTSTAAKLSINGAGSTTELNYLPREIRGVGNLWNTSTNKITPIRIGDSYNLRLTLPVTAKSGSPTLLQVDVDIGGGATPTNLVVNLDIALTKTPPYTISVAIPIFCLTTFLTNGGQIFLKTDTGTIDITGPSVFLDMNTSGNI